MQERDELRHTELVKLRYSPRSPADLELARLTPHRSARYSRRTLRQRKPLTWWQRFTRWLANLLYWPCL